jgi:GDP-L-fucose synthase
LAKKNNEKFFVWGDGTPLRQFIHSKDLAKNILWALNNWKEDKHFMAINETEYTVMDMVKIITKKFNIDDDLIFDPTKPSGQFRKPAKSDIPSNYDFISIENGITKTIDWFINNYETIRK